jgi:hypothetical protein
MENEEQVAPETQPAPEAEAAPAVKKKRASKKKAVEVAEVAEVAAPEAAPAATEATVYTKGGNLVRTYTLADHGEGFVDLAKQMAAQHPESTIDVR